MVELNRAIAAAEAHGPEAGLKIIDRVDEARDAYRRALELVRNDAERRLLQRRLDQL